MKEKASRKKGGIAENFLLNGGEWKDDTKLKKIKSNK